METHYFTATEEDEYQSWMAEITRGAVKQTSNTSDYDDMASLVYYYPKDYHQPARKHSVESSPDVQRSRVEDNQSSSSSEPLLDIPGVTHHGPLKKRSDKGSWNIRYCRLRENCLYVYFTGSDQTPITVLAVKHCKVEPIKLPPEESTEQFTFIVAVKGGKTHTFAAADEQDVQAWLRVLQECVQSVGGGGTRPRSDSRGSRTQSPLLSSHSKGTPTISPARSRMSNRQSNLVTHIPASTLVDSTRAGYCEIKQGEGAWSRSWCVLHQKLLYVYQSKESKSSIRTLALQGYKIEQIQTHEREFVISLSHPRNPSLMMSASDQTDMSKWLEGLEGSVKPNPLTSTSTEEGKPTVVAKTPDTKVKVSDTAKDKTGSSEALLAEAKGSFLPNEGDVSLPELGEGPLNVQEYKEKCKLVASHFEKRIKKTRKVAQQTEENLTKQRAQLSTLQEKFLEHIERLKSAPNESETSQKKMKEMEVKLNQIGKILPYLEKYMQANRQAELQTLAILKEGCTVKLQELENRYRKRSGSISGNGSPRTGKIERRMSMPSDIGSPRSKKSKKHKNDLQTSIKEKQVKEQTTTTTTTNHSETKEDSQQMQALVEEPAYATVGHSKHKHSREPSLPEHYVKLQLNQDITVVNQQQEVGVHYSVVQMKPHQSASDSFPVSTPNVSTSQDRGTPPTGTEENTVAPEDREECESPHSPLVFTSTAGVDGNDDEIVISLNTSSETSLGLLDTVVEEDSWSPVTATTTTPSVLVSSPTASTPTNTTHDVSQDERLKSQHTLPSSSSHVSAISSPPASSSPAPPPPPASSPPAPPPPPASSPPAPLPPSAPPPPSGPPTSSPPAPPPPSAPPRVSSLSSTSSPPVQSPPIPSPTQSAQQSTPKTSTTLSTSLTSQQYALTSDNASTNNSSSGSSSTSSSSGSSSKSVSSPSVSNSSAVTNPTAGTTPSLSIPSRPPPPPVMKKSRSPSHSSYKRLPSPNESPVLTTKTVPVVPVKQSGGGSSPVPPPPVKTKPKRQRANTVHSPMNDTTDVSLNQKPRSLSQDGTNEVSTKNLPSVAQRIKAFQ